MSEYMHGPLPAATSGQLKATTLDKANKGLAFTRLFQGYNADFDEINTASKNHALNKFNGECGSDAALKAATARISSLVGSLGGELRVFATDWHFVTGMGNENPVENGFTWHPTLGTPYIPGSTIKGLVRCWAEEYTDLPTATLQSWFGSAGQNNGNSNNQQAGELIFLDAIPLSPPTLAVDIMTPHMGKWYEQGDKKATADTIPGDWHAPIPVPFLVTRDAKFLFAIAPRAGCQPDLAPALDALEQALAWLGIGSKTAAGYGHMTLATELTAKMQATTLSAEELQLHELLRLFTDEQRFAPNPAASTVKQRLRDLASNPELLGWSTGNQQKLLAFAEEALKFHDGKQWNKKTKKQKPSTFMQLKAHLSGEQSAQ